MKPITKYKKLPKYKINDLYIQSCQKGEFNNVKLFLNELEDNNANIGFNNNEGFNVACYYGYIDIVKYLKESKELKEKMTLNESVFIKCIESTIIGFRSPSKINVMHYLFSMEEFKDVKHDYNEYFRMAFLNNNIEVIKYLIFDRCMEKSNVVQKMLIENDKNKDIKETILAINKFFEIKKIHSELEEDLNENIIVKKSIKSIKSKTAKM